LNEDAWEETWQDGVGKKEVAERTGIGNINEEIKCRRWKCLGHVLRNKDIHFEHVLLGLAGQFVGPETRIVLYLRRGIIKGPRDDTLDIVMMECRNYTKCRKLSIATLCARTTLWALAHAFKIMNNECLHVAPQIQTYIKDIYLYNSIDRASKHKGSITVSHSYSG
jgi:hypothetical protein